MEEENNSGHEAERIDDWVTGKDKIRTLKKVLSILLIIIIVFCISFSYEYLTSHANNVNPKLSLEISVVQSESGICVYYFINNTGWRPANIINSHMGSESSQYYHIFISNAEGNNLAQIKYTEYEGTHKLDPGEMSVGFTAVRNYETYEPWCYYNSTNSSGPYQIQLIYDSTSSNMDVWKGMLESNTVVLDVLP